MKAAWKFLFTLVVIAAVGFVLLVLPLLRAELLRMNFQKNLKQRTTAEELLVWSARFLAPYQTNQETSLWIEIKDLPPVFHGLDKWPPTAWVRDDSQTWFNATDSVPYIKIRYGSAAGHFGVLLGPTNLPAPANREHEIRYTTWEPGIWFFDGQ